jgi:hypothetical protein
MKTKLYLAVFGLAIGLGWAQPGSAAVLFSDDFNSEPQSLGTVPFSPAFANWTVTAGSVDVIGTGGSFDYYPGNGNYVDLNGSSSQNGELTSKLNFAPGTFTLSFSLGGSQGGAGAVDAGFSKTTFVTLGSFASGPILLAWNDPLTTHTFTFSTLGGPLVFRDVASEGSNLNVGNILDNVQVSAVPEASTWVLMLFGFAGIGFVAYRRSKKSFGVLQVS